MSGRTAPRTLLAYQRRWVQDRASLKVCEKGRRIGLSWAEAYAAVLHAGEGKGDVYYQSYSHDMTRGFVGDCAEWARALQIGAEAIGETLIAEEGGADPVQAFRLRLASGCTVTAMTSSPRAFRSKGRPGDVGIIDEAAYCDDLDAVLKAALAFLTWGGSVRVISTHHGEASPFARLVAEVREARRPGSLHRIPLRAALDDGLFQRICAVTGREWTAAAEAAWEQELRTTYGAAAAEELDCIPSAAGGAWLAWDLLRAAEHPEAGDPAHRGGGGVWVGVDVARRADLWVAAVVERSGRLLWVRELRAVRGIPFREQTAIVRELAARWRPVRIVVDQTGMGEALVEQWQDELGRRLVEGVQLTAGRRLDVATALREAFEDRRMRIPSDEALRQDLHAVRAEQGPTGAPRLVAERSGTDGHADRFWALALAVAGASDRPAVYAAHRVDLRRPQTGRHVIRPRGASLIGPSVYWRQEPGGLH